MLKDELLGAEVVPLRAARHGYRSVFLRSPKGPELELGSVLVEVRLRALSDEVYGDEAQQPIVTI